MESPVSCAPCTPSLFFCLTGHQLPDTHPLAARVSPLPSPLWGPSAVFQCSLPPPPSTTVMVASTYLPSIPIFSLLEDAASLSEAQKLPRSPTVTPCMDTDMVKGHVLTASSLGVLSIVTVSSSHLFPSSILKRASCHGPSRSPLAGPPQVGDLMQLAAP